MPMAPRDVSDVLWACAVWRLRDDAFITAAVNHLLSAPLDVEAFGGSRPSQASQASQPPGAEAAQAAPQAPPSMAGMARPGSMGPCQASPGVDATPAGGGDGMAGCSKLRARRSHMASLLVSSGVTHGGGLMLTSAPKHDPVMPPTMPTLAQLHKDMAAWQGRVTEYAQQREEMGGQEQSGAEVPGPEMMQGGLVTPDSLVRMVWSLCVLKYYNTTVLAAAFK